ncbi:MAG: acyltransferase family protein [Pseudodesulfovibrio sp.]|uniref:acyltransferase family protein n=1 Tax=Pseudodesulfovibrio sp. TaxID=2035812 RepID=UPI003D12794C
MNKDQSKQRDTSLDLVRIFGVALVVAGHSHFPWPLEKAIYSFHMPLFFFLSGMLFRDAPLAPLARKKFNTLIVPYIIACLLTALLYWVAAGPAFGSGFFLSIPYGILWAHSPDSLYWNSPLWFLPALFWSFLGLTLFCRLAGARLGPPLSALAGIALVGLAARHRELLPLGLDTATEGLVFVSLGMPFAQVLAKLRPHPFRLAALAALSFAVWLAVFAAYPDYFVVAHLKVFPLWVWLLVSLSGTVAAVAAFTAACDLASDRLTAGTRRWLAKAATYSFPLYMFHKPIINLLAEGLQSRGYAPQSAYPLIFVLGVAITMAGILLLERCTPRLYALAVGGRVR